MKRFLPLLIILPLSLWVSCEEKTEDFTFIEEWVKCKNLTSELIFEDSESMGGNYEYVYNWSGNTVEVLKNGELNYTYVYNEYGQIIRSLYHSSGSETYYEIFDKWKTLSETSIDASGDTSNINYWEWDGLSVDIYRDSPTDHAPPYQIRKYFFNEFGRLLEAYNIDENDSIVWHRVWEYEDDGRRAKSRTTDGVLYIEYQWNGNSRTQIYYDDGQLSFKDESTLNEYYLAIQSKNYQYIDGSWQLYYTSNFEYECPGFEQIYP